VVFIRLFFLLINTRHDSDRREFQMSTGKKIFTALLVIGLVWGWWYGGWAGSLLVLIVFAVISGLLGSRENKNKADELRVKSQEAIIKLGEMVPAKRGNPDPTRPNEEMAGYITANYDRIKEKFQ
jgi:hypothetical protein